MVVAASKKEKKYLENDIFVKDIIASTGLPRYDKLARKKTNGKIMISFTWRQELKSSSYKKLLSSEYVKKIKELVGLFETNKISATIIFHPNMDRLEELFVTHKKYQYIDFIQSQKINYREAISNYEMLVTDYSSLAFDFAYLQKPIIYYHFDRDYFFNNHTYKEHESLFNYLDDGFGEVFEKSDNIISTIKKLESSNFQMENKYKNKINNFFLYQDKKNSERLFKKIQQRYK